MKIVRNWSLGRNPLTVGSTPVIETKNLSVDYLKQFSSSAGDSDYFVVTSNTSWQIISYPSWCTITPLSGTGNANVTVAVSANTGAERSGNIILSGINIPQNVSLTATQLVGAAPTSTLNIAAISNFSASVETKVIAITSNTSWRVVSYPLWVTISPLSGFSNGSISLTSELNVSVQRTGTLILEGTGVVNNIEVVLTQLTGATTSADYYLAPNGNDSNPGTEAQPFATLTKLWTVVQPGDLVYLRGGNYPLSGQVTLNNVNGTAGNLIKIWAYPGEQPIFIPNNYVGTAIKFCGSYFHWKGIEIKNFNSSTQYALGFKAGDETGWGVATNNNIFENFNVHHCTAGFNLQHRATNNWIKNSDFHHNYSIYNTGNDSDGVAINYQVLGETNKISGCRSWSNGDDGIDFSDSDGFVECSTNWAWHNGYSVDSAGNATETPVGDGHGYKLGWNLSSERGGLDNVYGTYLRLVVNCLSFDNYTSGFSQQNGNMIMKLFNNTAYNNANAFSWQAFAFGGKNTATEIRNNISYLNEYPALTLSNMIVDHNAWNVGINTPDANDFVSLDSTGIDGSRQADGSLPNLNFLKLRPTSDLIGAGVDLGYGTNIGAY